MAQVTKTGVPSPCTPTPPSNARLDTHPVGENIAAGDACYISQTDGKIYRSDGSANGVLGGSAEVDGFAPKDALLSNQESLSLYHDVNFRYATGLTPGTFLYLSETVLGGFQDTAGAKQPKPIGRTMPGGRVRVLRTYGG